jgi:undecaprenyl diphosphate synthase
MKNIKPDHIAIIMDGNGRWASNKKKSRRYGHKKGASTAKNVVKIAGSNEIKYLTLYAFSTENWGRPTKEVRLLMSLFIETLENEIDELNSNNVSIRFIGDRENLSKKLQDKMENAEKITSDNTGLNLYVALAYGARWDILNAIKGIVTRVKENQLDESKIDENTLSSHLQLGDIPDPDLLIRTGGEKRISNFLLWNIAYTELFFCDCLWPEFNEKEFFNALDFYSKRKRRFGSSV